MATRSYADVAPTASTMALNAYIYGYGGHSLVTPHTALKKLWWTDRRIEDKVTRSYILSKLRTEERQFLDRQLAFGEGLTDDTYMDWILERAKRLFLILAEVGVPDQIFGCIDDSWDDDDLPVSLDNVKNLELSFENDPALNQRFYDMQFVYLLRELKKGSHLDYGPKEHIPMEHVNTLPPAANLQMWSRIHFPRRPDEIFTRRKFPLAQKGSKNITYETCIRDIRKAQSLPHQHIASVWGSYTSENAAYVLSDFIGEHTIATFIDHRTPPQYMRVPAAKRPALIYEWMHCLSDALACLHHRGVAHTAIRPSEILIDKENHIAFADVGSIRLFQRGKKSRKSEAYDYGAPELSISKTPFSLPAASPPVSSLSAFSKLRKMSISTSTSSSSADSIGSSGRSDSTYMAASPFESPRSSLLPPNVFQPLTRISSGSGQFTRNMLQYPLSPPDSISGSSNNGNSVPPSPIFGPRHDLFPLSSTLDPSLLSDLPTTTPQQADIFSLACIYLDLLTFLLYSKLSDFIKHRTSRPSTRSSSSRPDSSFQANPDRITSWMDRLRAEASVRRPADRALPAILDAIIRPMLAQNANLRPSAADVRDRLATILVADAAVVPTLCCGSHRLWPDPPSLPDPDPDDHRGADPSLNLPSSQRYYAPPASPATRARLRPASRPTAADSFFDLDDAHGNEVASTTRCSFSTVRRPSVAGSEATAKQRGWRRLFGGR